MRFNKVVSQDVESLIRCGLVRRAFIEGANAETLVAAEIFAKEYNSHLEKKPLVDNRIGTLMIRSKILTPSLIENAIVGYQPTPDRVVYRQHSTDPALEWAQRLAHPATVGLRKLVQQKKIGTPIVIKALQEGYWTAAPWLWNEDLQKRMLTLLTPHASNIINSGITDIVESESAMATALDHTPTKYKYSGAFLQTGNQLLRSMRAVEHLQEKKKQIDAIISSRDKRPVRAQMQDIWQHYAQHARSFHKFTAETPVGDAAHAANVTAVNAWQANMLLQPIAEPQKRFVDLYCRYNHAEMDPLMMSLMALTTEWYITQRHARLFTHMRLVPDRNGLVFNHQKHKFIDAVSWGTLAVCPSMSLLQVQGSAFKTSMHGANRIFPTYSAAREASDEYSIPLIGIAIWQNKHKFTQQMPYALIEADFDKADVWRIAARKWAGRDVAASFAGIIDQTLLALREAEDLEIARANGIAIALGYDHHWKVQPQTAKPAAARPKADIYDSPAATELAAS